MAIDGSQDDILKLHLDQGGQDLRLPGQLAVASVSDQLPHA
jgi:hypothetical protein